MVIISSRKFRDSQNEYFQKALKEDVILTTVKFGSFRLIPVIEGEPRMDNVAQKPVDEPQRPLNKLTVETRDRDYPTIQSSRIIDEGEGVGIQTAYSEEASRESHGTMQETLVPMQPQIQIEAERVVPKMVISDEISVPTKKVEAAGNVFVDPSLYDTNPREYAKELEEERRMIEELRYRGIRKLLHNMSKKK